MECPGSIKTLIGTRLTNGLRTQRTLHVPQAQPSMTAKLIVLAKSIWCSNSEKFTLKTKLIFEFANAVNLTLLCPFLEKKRTRGKEHTSNRNPYILNSEPNPT